MDQIIKNSKKYITLKRAAQISGYSSDYIGFLIREGKIEGKKVYTNFSWKVSFQELIKYCQKNKGLDTRDSFLDYKKKYLSLKEAAKLSGYTPDYVGYLVRKGKISGKKVYSAVSWMTTEEVIRKYKEKKKIKEKKKLFILKPFSLPRLSLPKRNFNLSFEFSKYAVVFMILVGIIILNGLIVWAANINSAPQIKTADIYSTQHMKDSFEGGAGWQNPENVQGIPQVGPGGSLNSFSETNSAVYVGGSSNLIIFGFSKTQADFEILAEEKIEIEIEEEFKTDEILEDELEGLSEEAAEETLESETPEQEFEVPDNQESEQELEQEPEQQEEEQKQEEDFQAEEEIEEEETKEEMKEPTEEFQESEEIETEKDPEKENISFLERLKGIFANRIVRAEEIPSFKNLKEKKLLSAKIKFSFAIGEKINDLMFPAEERDGVEEEIIFEEIAEPIIETDSETTTDESLLLIEELTEEELIEEGGMGREEDLLEEEIDEEILEETVEEAEGVEEVEEEKAGETKQTEEESLEKTEKAEEEVVREEETGFWQEIKKLFSTLRIRITSLVKNFTIKMVSIAKAEDLEQEILPNIDGKIIIWWSLGKSSPVEEWQVLDIISDYPLSNALNSSLGSGGTGSYFIYDAPFLGDWDDIENLKIKFEGVVGGETIFIAYLDSVWVEVDYQEKEEEFELIAVKKDWRADETPIFEIVSNKEDVKEESIFENLIGQTFSLFQKELKIELKLAGPQNKELKLKEGENFQMETHSPTEITIFRREEFRPGKYKLEVQFEKEGKIYILEQDFTWGVLTININKSIYTPEDNQAYIQMGVVDDEGHTICDAHLEMTIVSPGGIEKYLSTFDNTIFYSGECAGDSYVEVPDYFSYYDLSHSLISEKAELGEYEIELIAHTKNGTRTIADSFEVRESVLFDVERMGPTRIYPPATYEIRFKIKVNQDFQGEVVEHVPDSFEIKSEISDSKFQILNSKIIWQADWKRGEEYELKYQFNAPNISPYLHLIGPLKFYE